MCSTMTVWNKVMSKLILGSNLPSPNLPSFFIIHLPLSLSFVVSLCRSILSYTLLLLAPDPNSAGESRDAAFSHLMIQDEVEK